MNDPTPPPISNEEIASLVCEGCDKRIRSRCAFILTLELTCKHIDANGHVFIPQVIPKDESANLSSSGTRIAFCHECISFANDYEFHEAQIILSKIGGMIKEFSRVIDTCNK